MLSVRVKLLSSRSGLCRRNSFLNTPCAKDLFPLGELRNEGRQPTGFNDGNRLEEIFIGRNGVQGEPATGFPDLSHMKHRPANLVMETSCEPDRGVTCDGGRVNPLQRLADGTVTCHQTNFLQIVAPWFQMSTLKRAHGLCLEANLLTVPVLYERNPRSTSLALGAESGAQASTNHQTLAAVRNRGPGSSPGLRTTVNSSMVERGQPPAELKPSRVAPINFQAARISLTGFQRLYPPSDRRPLRRAHRFSLTRSCLHASSWIVLKSASCRTTPCPEQIPLEPKRTGLSKLVSLDQRR